MSLTNSQYDAILREYDAIQLKNERLLSERKAEIADRLPAYEELTSAAASLSVSYGKRCFWTVRAVCRNIMKNAGHFP